MKRLAFVAILIASLFGLNSAKAQVGVHVGLNFGTPYYAHPRPVYVEPAPAPVYYSEPAYYPAYHHYYAPRRVVVVRRGYYAPRRVVVVNRYYHRGYRRW